jgi:outer membrane cobalamin receptor
MPRLSVRILLSFAFSTLLILAGAPAAFAAGQISGRVVDQAGQPVSGARVLASSGGAAVASAETDRDGRFMLTPQTDGRLTLRVAVEGFRAETLSLDAGSEPRDVGTLTVRVSALAESVVVSASQVEVPLSEVTASVTIVDGSEIESRQLHSVGDALRSVPGLTLVSTGGLGATTGLFPRGGESNYTLVVIDGVPANSFGGDFDFGHLSTANLDRIEVVRGPQSALFGANAIGSVVRLVTRRGGRPSAQLDLEAGHFGTSRISASSAGSRGSFEWGGSFDQLLSEGRNGDTTAGGERIENDDYERRGVSASAGWRRGGSWLRGDVRHAVDERGFPGPFGSNPAGIYSGIDTVARGENSRTLAGASFFKPVTARWRVHAQANHNRVDSDFASAFGTSEAYSRRWTGRLQSDVSVAPGLDISAGVEGQRERAGSTFITGASAQKIPVSRANTGYFAEGRWSARDRLFVTAGLRVERIRRDRIEESPSAFSPRPVLPTDTVVSSNPRLAAAWLARSSASDYTRLRGAVGTGIRPPDGFELAFTDNPGLRPERSVSAEAGVDHGFAAGHGLLEATFFSNDYDDLIVAVGSFSGASRYQTDNISNARARGLELAVTGRGRVARAVEVTGRVGYTRLDTEILAIDQDRDAPPPFEVGQDLLRRPRHQFFADASIATARLGLFVRAGGRGRTLDVEPSYGTFGGLFDARGYHVWSTGASWRIVKAVELFGRVENLFDRSYEEAFGFPALGRRATAGLRVAAGR